MRPSDVSVQAYRFLAVSPLLGASRRLLRLHKGGQRRREADIADSL
jgi:hypothetical protein